MQIAHPECNLRKSANLVYFDSGGQGTLSIGFTEAPEPRT